MPPPPFALIVLRTSSVGLSFAFPPPLLKYFAILFSVELKLYATSSAAPACRASPSRQTPTRSLALCVGLHGSRRAACAPKVRDVLTPGFMRGCASILIHRFPLVRGRLEATCPQPGAAPPAADERLGEFGRGDAGCSVLRPRAFTHPLPCALEPCVPHATRSCGCMGFLCRVPLPLCLTLRVFTPSAAGGAHAACIPFAHSVASPPTLSSHESARAPSAGHVKAYGVTHRSAPLCMHAGAAWYPARLLNVRRIPASISRHSDSPGRLSRRIPAPVQIPTSKFIVPCMTS
ncbi:hypothetical protein FB451DRAFT_1388232 [Mycena latifolia]|nr:hypothetical protein FB451DRAFT_1388232 [Mycena latifolia]